MEAKKKNIVIVSLINFIKGIIFGGTVLVPGVSGGTIALIIGLYEDLISSVNNLFKGKKQFVKSVIFLIPVGLGAVVGVFGLASLLKYCVDNLSLPTNMLFAGLVIGSIPYLLYLIYPDMYKKRKEEAVIFSAESAVAQKTDKKTDFKAWHIVPVILAAAVVVTMAFLNPQEKNIASLTVWQYVFLPIAGFITAVAMIIPGVSGAFTLKLMGWYDLILAATDSFNFLILGLFAFGAILGVVAAAKIIEILFRRLKKITYLAILGLVAGCVAAIFIDRGTYKTATGTWGIIIGAVLMLIGLAAAVYFGYRTMKSDEKKAAKAAELAAEEAKTEIAESEKPQEAEKENSGEDNIKAAESAQAEGGTEL